jgi:hypothetical protein
MAGRDGTDVIWRRGEGFEKASCVGDLPNSLPAGSVGVCVAAGMRLDASRDPRQRQGQATT